MSFCYLNAETKMKKQFFLFKTGKKKNASPANELPLHKCRNNRKMIKINFSLSNPKKLTSPPNEYLLQGIENNCTSPSNEFLLYRIERKKNAKVLPMSFSYKHADRRTSIYPPLDERYSPITSSICGPKNPTDNTIFASSSTCRAQRDTSIQGTRRYPWCRELPKTRSAYKKNPQKIPYMHIFKLELVGLRGIPASRYPKISMMSRSPEASDQSILD